MKITAQEAIGLIALDTFRIDDVSEGYKCINIRFFDPIKDICVSIDMPYVNDTGWDSRSPDIAEWVANNYPDMIWSECRMLT